MSVTTIMTSPTLVTIDAGTSGTFVLGTTGLTGVTMNITGYQAYIEVDGSSGSNVTINNSINLGSALHLNTDGADFILDSALLSANVLSGTSVTISNGGTFETKETLIALNVLSSSGVTFGTGGGTYLIDSSAFISLDLLDNTAPIVGFDSSADIIRDDAFDYAKATGYSISGTQGGTETITVQASDATSLTLDIAAGTFATGSYALGEGPLLLSEDAAGGLVLTVCFLEGTMIATPDGEAAVETLKPGDLVLTADGRAVAVRWLGINTVATRFADPLRNMPIRLRAGALGAGLPRRDLLVSPDHALLIDGLLVQAGAMTDGIAIRQERQMAETFRYYHVETAAHDLILAEGVPAETFADNVSRRVFDNWEEFLALCGGEVATGEMAYPRVKSHRQLPPPLRRRLAALAAHLHEKPAA